MGREEKRGSESPEWCICHAKIVFVVSHSTNTISSVSFACLPSKRLLKTFLNRTAAGPIHDFFIPFFVTCLF